MDEGEEYEVDNDLACNALIAILEDDVEDARTYLDRLSPGRLMMLAKAAQELAKQCRHTTRKPTEI